MHDNLKKLLQKEMTRKNFLHLIAIGIISILGFGGVISFLLAHASTPDISAEAEGGTLAGGATIGSDTNASGDEYVKFGTAPSGGSGSPTPMMSEYSSYVLADGGDFEFNTYTSVNDMPSAGIWVNSPDYQVELPTSIDNVAVGSDGLVLTLASSESGACIDTDSTTMSPGIGTADPGFACELPFYREIEFICATASNGYNNNHQGSWMLGTAESNGGTRGFEVDLNEVLSIDGSSSDNDGIVMGHLHTGDTSQYGSSGVYMGKLSGTHKVGVYVTDTEVTWYLDGALVTTASSEALGGGANPQTWPNENPPSTLQMYPLHMCGNDSYGGEVEYGGIYTVIYDRFFIAG